MKIALLVISCTIASLALAAAPTTQRAVQTLDNSAELAVDVNDAAVEVLVNGRPVMDRDKPTTGQDFVSVSDMVRSGKNSVSVRWLPRAEPPGGPETIAVELTVIRTVKQAGDAFMPMPLKRKEAKVVAGKPREQQGATWEFTIDNYPIDDLPWLKGVDRKFTEKDADAVRAAAKQVYDAVAARDEKKIAALYALKYQRQAKLDEAPLPETLKTWESMWKIKFRGDDFALDPWKPEDLRVTKLDGINLVQVIRKGEKARVVGYKIRGRDTGVAEVYLSFVEGAWRVVD